MVSNNGSFTLYGVYLRCGVAEIVLGNGARIHDLGLQNQGSTVGDIPRHDQRPFTCPIDVQGVKEAQLWLDVSWKLHLLGVIPWKRQQDYTFELKWLADGRASWQAGH